VILDNQKYGVHLGEKDTDNVVRGNEIQRSGEAGVIFVETDKGYCPDRNRIENNRIVDSGPDNGVGIDVQGETDAVAISRNELRETRQALKRIGVRIGAQARNVQLSENSIEGFALNVSDLRAHSAIRSGPGNSRFRQEVT